MQVIFATGFVFLNARYKQAIAIVFVSWSKMLNLSHWIISFFSLADVLKFDAGFFSIWSKNC